MSFIRKVKVGNHTYLQEVESVWEDGKSKHKYIRTIGKEFDGKRILNGSAGNLEVTNVKIYGPLLVLNEIAKEIDLHAILGTYSGELLSMIYSQCIDPKSLNKMEEWFSKTDLNHILNLQNLTERRLVNSLEDINTCERIDYFQHKIFSSLEKKYDLDVDSFFYDVTNVYFFGTECKLAKRGKSKEGGFKRTVQIGLCVTKIGIPIFHKTFAGNVFDARTLFDVMKSLPEYSIKKTVLVWDRGVTSKVNIIDAKKLGFEVLCGIALRGKIVEDVDKLILEKNITVPSNRVALNNCSYYVVKTKYSYENVSGYLHVCLNRKQQVEEQEKRLKKIDEVKKLIKNNKKIKKPLKKYCKYVSKNNVISKNILDNDEKHDGISVIFCTKNISSFDVVKRYFEKDTVEKAFACLKGVIKIRPIRKWLEERVRAHIFICHISYLLLSILDYKLKKKNTSFNSVEAMGQLESVYKIDMLDKITKNKFTKIVTLTKNQEKILRAVNRKLIKPSN